MDLLAGKETAKLSPLMKLQIIEPELIQQTLNQMTEASYWKF